MKTQRNGIEALIAPNDQDMAAQIDAVYEIADAELTSEDSIYRQGMRIIEKNPASHKVIQAMSEVFLPHVKRIASRDEMMSGVPEVNFKAIAERLAKDFDDVKGKDYRRTQTSGHSL